MKENKATTLVLVVIFWVALAWFFFNIFYIFTDGKISHPRSYGPPDTTEVK